MKDIGNPSYSEKTLAETSFSLEGVTFEIRGVEESKDNFNLSDSYFKILFSVYTKFGNHNGGACIQQDFASAQELKKLGMWLIENAERIDSAVDKRAEEFNE